MKALQLLTKPTNYPISVDEVKLHSRIDNDAEDSFLNMAIAAATNRVEAITGKAIISQTWIEYFDTFPAKICLRKGDVQSVTSVKYIDNDDVVQTVDTAIYDVDIYSNPARVISAFGKSWPSDVKDTLNAVYVEYVAGFGDDSSDVPDDLKWALFLLTGHFYENREATTDLKLIETPMGVDSLLARHKVWWMRS